MKHFRNGIRGVNAKRGKKWPSSFFIAQRLLVIIVCCAWILHSISYSGLTLERSENGCPINGERDRHGDGNFLVSASASSGEPVHSSLKQKTAASEMDKNNSKMSQSTRGRDTSLASDSVKDVSDDEEFIEWLWKSPRPIAWTDHSNYTFVEKRHSCIRSIRQKQEKLFRRAIFQGQKYENLQEIVLVDPAMHQNVGDNMLSSAEWIFIQKNLRRKDFKQCHIFQALNFFPKCHEVLSRRNDSSSVALWHAGGNWGDLYGYTNRPRMESFQVLLQHGYRIVGLPQSLFYKDQATRLRDTRRIKQKIAEGLGFTHPSALDIAPGSPLSEWIKSQVTFFWREKESLAEAQQLYPFVTNLLVPDIAFQLGPFAPIRKHPEKFVDIIVFLRSDAESKISSLRNKEAIEDLLSDKSLSFRIVDWVDQQGIFGKEGEAHFTEEAIELLSLGKVVICDRLHASVLAYLSGLPFVYIDQVTLKLTKTLGAAFEGINDCLDSEGSLWTKASSLKEALVRASELIQQHSLNHSRGYLWNQRRLL